MLQHQVKPDTSSSTVKSSSETKDGRRGSRSNYLDLNSSKVGYIVSSWFTFWTFFNIIFASFWASWPLKMQEIEIERREWSKFCLPISDCGKCFGGALICFALFQLFSYIAAKGQKNRYLPPKVAVVFFYFSVLAYCIICILTVVSAVVIFHTETGKFCGYESPPFKEEAVNFFWYVKYIFVSIKK